jgi:death-on-curing protein
MSHDYLTLAEVIEMHRQLIDRFGGSHGIREIGALESAVLRPQMGYYEDLIAEAAALMESLAMNHPFVDGNKRIAFFAADTFLRVNGQWIDCDDAEAYRSFMAMFEQGTFDFHHLETWLRNHVRPLG